MLLSHREPINMVSIFSFIRIFNYFIFLPILAPVGPPLNLFAYPLTHTIVKVEWNVPNIYFQNGVITRFTLTYTSLDFIEHQQFERILPVRDNSTRFSFIILDLLESVTYNITVAASTIVGLGPLAHVETSTYNTGLNYLLKAMRSLLYSFCSLRSI